MNDMISIALLIQTTVLMVNTMVLMLIGYATMKAVKDDVKKGWKDH